MAKDSSSEPPTDRDKAERLYAGFRSQLDDGEVADIESLCRAHPALATKLRSIDDQWRRVRELLPGMESSRVGEDISFFAGQRTQPPLPMAGAIPGQVIDDFRLVSLLGEGGMGQVWKAEQLSLERTVALKLLRPDRVSRRALDLLAREARAGGRVQHPGIVVVHGHGEFEGIGWIAMECIEGAWTLRDFIAEQDQQGDLPAGYYRKVAEFVSELADALSAAHSSGIIHRDLKPANILIRPNGRPKVSDFGLARITDESALSTSGEIAGTYSYMSPEQVSAKRSKIDHRTDIFSLGIVLYEMITLRRPFEGDTAQQVAQRIVSEEPASPRAVRRQIPEGLSVICGNCLEKEPDRRYSNMEGLAADLHRHLANQTIHPTRPTHRKRATDWMRRHPTKGVTAALATAAVGLVSILTILIGPCHSAPPLDQRSSGEHQELEASLPAAMFKLTASDAESADRFGYAVCMGDGIAIVGAGWTDDLGIDAGSVYVFEESAWGWVETSRITGSTVSTRDLFGWSVSISGDTLLVGAPAGDDVPHKPGSVFVFERVPTGWVETQRLVPNNASGGQKFGWCVSLHEGTALVGSPYWDDLRGTAYIFEKTSNGWVETRVLSAADGGAKGRFGWSVSLSSGAALVGAEWDDAAYVFERARSGDWFEATKLTASDGGSGFGRSVSIFQETVIIGARSPSRIGEAFVFERAAGGNWHQTTRLSASNGGPSFANSIALYGDRVLIGALYDTDNGPRAGAAYLFERRGSTWIETSKLTAHEGGNARFGASVSIFEESLLIGAYWGDRTGFARVFEMHE